MFACAERGSSQQLASEDDRRWKGARDGRDRVVYRGACAGVVLQRLCTHPEARDKAEQLRDALANPPWPEVHSTGGLYEVFTRASSTTRSLTRPRPGRVGLGTASRARCRQFLTAVKAEGLYRLYGSFAKRRLQTGDVVAGSTSRSHGRRRWASCWRLDEGDVASTKEPRAFRPFTQRPQRWNPRDGLDARPAIPVSEGVSKASIWPENEQCVRGRYGK